VVSGFYIGRKLSQKGAGDSAGVTPSSTPAWSAVCSARHDFVTALFEFFFHYAASSPQHFPSSLFFPGGLLPDLQMVGNSKMSS
jgi:hypothetical protein